MSSKPTIRTDAVWIASAKASFTTADFNDFIDPSINHQACGYCCQILLFSRDCPAYTVLQHENNLVHRLLLSFINLTREPSYTILNQERTKSLLTSDRTAQVYQVSRWRVTGPREWAIDACGGTLKSLQTVEERGGPDRFWIELEVAGKLTGGPPKGVFAELSGVTEETLSHISNDRFKRMRAAEMQISCMHEDHTNLIWVVNLWLDTGEVDAWEKEHEGTDEIVMAAFHTSEEFKGPSVFLNGRNLNTQPGS